MSKEFTSNQLLYKPTDAAHLLQLSQRMLATLTSRGDLPCVRVDRSVRYCRTDLEKFCDSRRQNVRRNRR